MSDDAKAHVISAKKTEESLARTRPAPPPAAPEDKDREAAYWRHVAANLEVVLIDQMDAIERHFKEQHGDTRLFVFSDPAKTKILESAMAAKDAEIAEWSLKYAAEVVRANNAEEALKTAITTTARTSKTIVEERDALRIRAEKAEAEVAELRNRLQVGDLGAANHLAAVEAENDRLRAALEKLRLAVGDFFERGGKTGDYWKFHDEAKAELRAVLRNLEAKP